MIQIRAFKEKEKDEGERKTQLSGQWTIPMFGGLWKEKENHPFHRISLSPPTKFT